MLRLVLVETYGSSRVESGWDYVDGINSDDFISWDAHNMNNHDDLNWLVGNFGCRGTRLRSRERETQPRKSNQKQPINCHDLLRKFALFLVIFAKLSAPTSDLSVGPPSVALMDMTMGCYDN